MTDINQTRMQIKEQAEEWFVRMQSDQVCREDKKRFRDWCNRSRTHLQEYKNIERVWGQLGPLTECIAQNDDAVPEDQKISLSALDDLLSLDLKKEIAQEAAHAHSDSVNSYVTEIDQTKDISLQQQPVTINTASIQSEITPVSEDSNTTNIIQLNTQPEKPANEASIQRKSPHLAWLASVAAVALFVLCLQLLPQLTEESTLQYQTVAGEQREVHFDDGSIAYLNTNTAISVQYSDEKRAFTLLSGEAYFEVAKDKERPFVVDVGQGSVTAVGTAFNIRRKKHTVVVTVTEGVVKVAEKKEPANIAPREKTVRHSQAIVFDQKGLSDANGVQPALAVAWKDKILTFDQVSLVNAVAELNRYLPEPVDFVAPDIRDLKVSGTFSLEEPQTTLEAIATSFSLTLSQPENSDSSLTR